eukprot:TRINITY_DN3629_c0_g1_i1.p1 TRINITY_DN3629_c0_g1~~TRINITY_DN3629_c0_g1_i1.p1  ORF type:complete len:212 (-),score=33.31 TRINITY_DN3629_c0_g1_i1:413-1048(-)
MLPRCSSRTGSCTLPTAVRPTLTPHPLFRCPPFPSMALPSALLTMAPLSPLPYVVSPKPPRSASATRTARAAHFSRSLALCGNCSRVVGVQAYAGGALPGGAAAAAAAGAAIAIGGDGDERCYCSADCYWSSKLDGLGGRRRRPGRAARRPARQPARVMPGGCDGGEGGALADADGSVRRNGGGVEGVGHAMYAHHVEVWEASYGGSEMRA